MTKLTSDFIKFIAETILLLVIYSVVFDPSRGIITNSYFYLSYAEPVTLLNHISTAMLTAGNILGEFSTTFETSGMPYIIEIYEDDGKMYASLDMTEINEEYFNTEFTGIEPVPIVSDCQIREQTVRLEEGLAKKVIVRKTVVGNTCEVFIVTRDAS